MNQKIFIIISIILFLPLLISYDGGIGTFKQGQIVRIPQICSDAKWINISSISYPNSSTAVQNAPMIFSGNGEFYYYFSLTNVTGRYEVRGVSDGCEKTFVTFFDITGSGYKLDVAQAGISLGILFSAIFLIFVFIILSYKFLDKTNTFHFGLYFLLISGILTCYVLYLGLVYSQDYLFLKTTFDIQTKVFIGVLFSLIMICFIGMFFLTLKVIEQIKIKKRSKYNDYD